jgi:hypothetical protein
VRNSTPAVVIVALWNLVCAMLAIYALAYGFCRITRHRDAPFDREQFNRDEAANAAGGKHERVCPAHPQWERKLGDRSCRCDWIRKQRVLRLQRT